MPLSKLDATAIEDNTFFRYSTTTSLTLTTPVTATTGTFSSLYNSTGGFKSYYKTHSVVNTSAGAGSPTTTKITQISDYKYEYSYSFGASTGGYPACPYSYWIMCPVQKNGSNYPISYAEVKVFGVHRGMWGANGYEEYAHIVVGAGGDGGGVWVKEWLNGEANNSSNRIRIGYMDYNGVYTEQGPWNTTWNVAHYNANTINQSYYKMPFFLKFNTNCGADKEYMIQVTTSNVDYLGPPYNGPVWLAPNTAPTSGIYW